MECLENRELLSVTPIEYAEIRELYSSFELSENMSDVNVIDLSAAATSEQVQVALDAAKASPQDDLIVLRTTAEASSALFDRTLTIDFDENVSGKLTLVSYGSALAQLSSAENAVFSVKSGDVQLGGFAFVGKENGAAGNLDLTPAGDGATLTIERSIYLKQSGGDNSSGDAGTANEIGYSADFSVDGEKRGYVAGLTLSEAVELTSATYYFQTDVFFDVNKTWANTDDDELCWAAAASNMLKYAGFDAGMTADEIFQEFQYCFSDQGGNIAYGVEWFLNGYYAPAGWDDWAQIENEGGAHYPEVSVDAYLSSNNAWGNDASAAVNAVAQAALALQNGGAAGLSIGWYDAGDYANRDGGHAVTMWGYYYDLSQAYTSPSRYTDLIISCSDDYTGTSRRWRTGLDYVADQRCYVVKDYDSDGRLDSQYGVVERSYALKPYDDATAAKTFVVTTTADVVDPNDGVTSLREAALLARSIDRIVFSSSLKGKTITLSGSQLNISCGVTVDASALYNASTGTPGLTIDADGKSRVFYVDGGTASDPATLIGLTITGGYDDYGGAIYVGSTGSLALTNCRVTNSKADKSGGGLYVRGTATLTNSTISGNTAGERGGGLYVQVTATAALTDSTISNNAAVWGGGASVWGKQTLTNSLVVDNAATSGGGGLYVGGTATLRNATIAGNTAAWGGGAQVANDGTATFYNVILATNVATSNDYLFSRDVYDKATANAYNVLSSYTAWDSGSSNYVYDSSSPLFKNAANGDYALAQNSQAIDKGKNSYISGYATDLAGEKRVSGDRVDLGAYEYQAIVAAPTNVRFGAYNSSAKRATLTWTDNATNEIQSSTNGGAWRSLTDLAANTTSRVCYGLKPGNTYAYRVRAVASDGTASAWVSASIEIEDAAPAAPTNVRFGAYNSSTKTATLSWTDNATNEAYYEIQSSTNGGAWTSLTDLAANTTSRVCYGLKPGNTYAYRVRAVASDGTASAWVSASINLAAPAAPTNVRFGAYNSSAKRATLIWADNATIEVWYEIQSSTNGGEWRSLSDLAANETSRICHKLLPGNVYVYRVRAVSADGKASAWASATLDLTIPAGPTDAKFGDYDASTKTATLTWTDVATNEARYEIQSSTNGGEWTALADLPADTTSRVCSGLRPGNVYVYRVLAVSAEGVVSAWASATLDLTIPAGPTDAKFGDYDASTKTATLTWTDVATNEARYEIQSSTNGGEWTALADLPADTTSRVCYGLAPGNVYVYRIRAVAKGGVASAWVSATIAPIAAPTNVTFSDYNVSTKRATLTWTDNATNEVRYEIQSSTNGGEWTALSNLPADTTSRICYGLAAENVYAYRVRAVSADGTASAWVSATIAPASAPADAEFSDYDASTKRATLSWTDNATDEVRYEIQSSTNGGEWTALSDLPANATSRVCYGLAAENVYAYRVRAVSADGTATAWVSATIAPASAPADAEFSDYDASTKRATLSWTDNATDEVRYEIQSSTNGGEWTALSDLPANATSRVCYGLAAENVYAYRVRAVSADGTATAWVSAKIAPSTTPTNVKIVDYNASTKRATLTWTDNATDEVRYEIQSSTNGGEWRSLSDLAANATSRICYSLALGNVYVYRIRAVAADGTTSAWASATLDLAISESSESGSDGETPTSSATLASEAFANPFDDFDFFEEEWKFGF